MAIELGPRKKVVLPLAIIIGSIGVIFEAGIFVASERNRVSKLEEQMLEVQRTLSNHSKLTTDILIDIQKIQLENKYTLERIEKGIK